MKEKGERFIDDILVYGILPIWGEGKTGLLVRDIVGRWKELKRRIERGNSLIQLLSDFSFQRLFEFLEEVRGEKVEVSLYDIQKVRRILGRLWRRGLVRRLPGRGGYRWWRIEVEDRVLLEGLNGDARASLACD